VQKKPGFLIYFSGFLALTPLKPQNNPYKVYIFGMPDFAENSRDATVLQPLENALRLWPSAAVHAAMPVLVFVYFLFALFFLLQFFFFFAI
jgi:hypothetical protein